MSLKSLIKVANYYNIKYNLDKLAQIQKINPEYQTLINRILEVYKLGNQIEEDGWWGDNTIKALSAIQRRFKLNPFTNSKESLDQLYQVIGESVYAPLEGFFKTSSDFVTTIQSFKQFLILYTAIQSKWDAPDLIIKFFKGIKTYLNNIIIFANNLQKIPSAQIKEAAKAIIEVSNLANVRIEKRLNLVNELKLAQEQSKNTSSIIASLKQLQEEARENPILDILESNANQIKKEVFESYSSAGKYTPQNI